MKKLEKKHQRPFLYEDEIDKLLKACDETSHPIRNRAIVLLMYNHAFRSTELCNLRWDDIDFVRNKIFVRRQKGGVDFYHDLYDHENPDYSEREMILRVKEENKFTFETPYIFFTMKKKNFNRFALYMLFQRLREIACLKYAPPRALRHAKGMFLRKNKTEFLDIRDYMGHRHGASTEIYTRMDDNNFEGINKGSIFA